MVFNQGLLLDSIQEALKGPSPGPVSESFSLLLVIHKYISYGHRGGSVILKVCMYM